KKQQYLSKELPWCDVFAYLLMSMGRSKHRRAYYSTKLLSAVITPRGHFQPSRSFIDQPLLEVPLIGIWIQLASLSLLYKDICPLRPRQGKHLNCKEVMCY